MHHWAKICQEFEVARAYVTTCYERWQLFLVMTFGHGDWLHYDRASDLHPFVCLLCQVAEVFGGFHVAQHTNACHQIIHSMVRALVTPASLTVNNWRAWASPHNQYFNARNIYVWYVARRFIVSTNWAACNVLYWNVYVLKKQLGQCAIIFAIFLWSNIKINQDRPA